MTACDSNTEQVGVKRCRKCGQTKSRDGFGKNKGIKDGLHTYCKQCCTIARKAWYARDPEAFKRKQREYWNRPENGRSVKAKRWHAANPESAMLNRAKRRAEKRGIEFALTREDIMPLPASCPVLGIPLRKGNYTRDPNAYSLDRIDNKLGYIPGNVVVISNRANTLKNDATPEEILALARWIKAVNANNQEATE